MSGGTPRKLNALPESRTPLIGSGASSPVSNTLPGQVAITSEKADNVASSRYSFGGYGRILWSAVALWDDRGRVGPRNVTASPWLANCCFASVDNVTLR